MNDTKIAKVNMNNTVSYEVQIQEKIPSKKGASLYPRYIAYSDDDYKDVAAVLKKMHLNYNLKGNR